ncbi:hypothetical protein R1flu_010360 [Riccia fluitans]|uniref:Maturase K n=1 Tax=Riccia fluitans TaxID=41844 RepID=A0ABD1Z4V1_9MARC
MTGEWVAESARRKDTAGLAAVLREAGVISEILKNLPEAARYQEQRSTLSRVSALELIRQEVKLQPFPDSSFSLESSKGVLDLLWRWWKTFFFHDLSVLYSHFDEFV